MYISIYIFIHSHFNHLFLLLVSFRYSSFFFFFKDISSWFLESCVPSSFWSSNVDFKGSSAGYQGVHSWRWRNTQLMTIFPSPSTPAFIIQFPFIALVKRRGRTFWVGVLFRDNSFLPSVFTHPRDPGSERRSSPTSFSDQLSLPASLHGTENRYQLLLFTHIFVPEYKEKILGKIF